ncbi:MAG: COX15/CtaA family protein [Anaerolineae bacterium]|jgi:heme A synthase|nr:COX15/CtaA family protein [Anaerolineae bacterium]
MNTVRQDAPAGISWWFVGLALTTALLTTGLIVFGAVVRVTDSGLGCGSEWPLCHGSLIPPLDNLTAWIEWLHRLFAVLIGLFGLATLAAAWRAYRQRERTVLAFTVAAALLFAVQSALGAIVVIFELPPTFVTLHLGTAMLLLAALLVATVAAWHSPVARPRDQVTVLAYANAAFSLVIILTGALVRGSGATLACTSWPLCMGNVLLPLDMGQAAIIHMIHRFAVGALGVTLLILVWQVYRQRTEALVRGLAAGALLAYLLQAGVGALYVLSVAGAEWGAAHVGMAAVTWGLLVVLSTVEALNTGEIRKSRETSGEWNIQSNPA